MAATTKPATKSGNLAFWSERTTSAAPRTHGMIQSARVSFTVVATESACAP